MKTNDVIKYIIIVLIAQVLVYGMMSSRSNIASTGPRGVPFPIPGGGTDQVQTVSTGPRGSQIPIPVPPSVWQSPYWYNHWNARTEFDPSDEKR